LATIKDVAAKAGVSISTVSYAISGSRPISEETKAHITRVMEELDYRPHAIARSLASKKTRIIAILYPAVERTIGLSELSLITCAANAASALGYHLVLWSMTSNDARDLDRLVRQELVDGVLLMDVHNNDVRIPYLNERNIPFMLFGRDKSCPNESFVDVDFAVTVYQAIAWLSGKGHREICFLNQSKETHDSGYGPVVRTRDAFTVFSADLRIRGRNEFCAADAAEGYRKTAAILAETPETTAFIVMNDRILSGVIKAIEDSGKSIPSDVSIVAIVSSEATATMFIPKITTYEMEGRELMELAVGQLIAKLEESYFEVPRRLVPCRLFERMSTGPAPEKE